MFLLINRYATLFLSLLMLAVFSLVSWFSFDSYRRFAAHQSSLSDQSVKNTANEISHMISFLRRSVGLFAQQEALLLARLASQPDDRQAYDILRDKVRRYFPDHFAFTIANLAGTPLLKRSDPLLKTKCRRDLKFFADQHMAPQIYMHQFSSQSKYHFDVMTRYGLAGAVPALFFVSFDIKHVVRLMNHGRVSGHQMYLSEKSKSDGFNALKTDMKNTRLFQVDEEGMRHFTEKLDISNVLSTMKIAGTNWHVLDQVQPKLYRSEITSLALKGATITLLFLGFGAGLMSLFRREVDTTGRTRKTLFGIEADRRRIAMDMHDQVLSDLTHLARQCSSMRESLEEPEKIRAHLDRSQGSLDDIAAAIRAIIDDLHPAALDILGLEMSLRDYLDNKLVNVEQPRFSLRAERFDESRLSDVQRLNLYRIILEIVHNIVRHTKAMRCEIVLSMDANRLHIIVEDDGGGFNPRQRNRILSRGLANISTRARLIGAHIRWGRPKNFRAGTRFELETPLQVIELMDAVGEGGEL